MKNYIREYSILENKLWRIYLLFCAGGLGMVLHQIPDYYLALLVHKDSLPYFRTLVTGIPVFGLLWFFRTHDTKEQLAKTEGQIAKADEQIKQNEYFNGLTNLISSELMKIDLGVDQLIYLSKTTAVFNDGIKLAFIKRLKVCPIDFAPRKKPPRLTYAQWILSWLVDNYSDEEMDLNGCDFTNQNFEPTDFQFAKIFSNNGKNKTQNMIFGNASLQNADLQKANLQKANLRNADLFNAKLQKANLRNADLSNAKLQDAKLQDANLQSAKLQSADLQNADLQNADLQNANLQSAKLQSANLQNAGLQNADLQNANLQSAKLQKSDLQNANLQNTDLQNADLQNANLHNADLSNAKLQNADLQNACLFNAKLQNANLVGARLVSARLVTADLMGANLSGANLTDANLIGKKLLGAIIDDDTKGLEEQFHIRIDNKSRIISCTVK